MGRRQPRVKAVLPVRIEGIDQEGRLFSEHVCTKEISANGSRLAGVRVRVSVGDIISIAYRNRRARYRIQWAVVASYAPTETHLGLECVESGKELWPISLPVEGDDDSTPRPLKRIQAKKLGWNYEPRN